MAIVDKSNNQEFNPCGTSTPAPSAPLIRDADEQKCCTNRTSAPLVSFISASNETKAPFTRKLTPEEWQNMAKNEELVKRIELERDRALDKHNHKKTTDESKNIVVARRYALMMLGDIGNKLRMDPVQFIDSLMKNETFKLQFDIGFGVGQHLDSKKRNKKPRLETGFYFYLSRNGLLKTIAPSPAANHTSTTFFAAPAGVGQLNSTQPSTAPAPYPNQ